MDAFSKRFSRCPLQKVFISVFHWLYTTSFFYCDSNYRCTHLQRKAIAHLEAMIMLTYAINLYPV